jgi:hypothetical protein
VAIDSTIRRQSEFSFVYVNQDGSVRAISVGEQEYLTRRFDPFDGARPYQIALLELGQLGQSIWIFEAVAGAVAHKGPARTS